MSLFRLRQTLADAEEQFNTFVVIKEQYLQPTSPQEVNISCRMQAKIASMQDKTAFSALDEDSRRDILQAPLKEIVQMLEENLLAKFKQTPELLQWRENQKRQSIRESVSSSMKTQKMMHRVGTLNSDVASTVQAEDRYPSFSLTTSRIFFRQQKKVLQSSQKNTCQYILLFRLVFPRSTSCCV